MLDRSDREIQQGDFILYLTKEANFAGITFARVMMTKPNSITVQAYDRVFEELKRPSNLSAGERVLVIPANIIPKEELRVLSSIRP